MAVLTKVRPYRPRPGWRERDAWSFMLVGLVLLVIFLVVPFGLAVGMSFTNVRLLSPLPTRFVGTENYERILSDPEFIQAVGNNLRFALLVVPLQTGLALLLAVLVNQPLPGVKIFRAIYFMPLTMALAAAATIWKLLYVPDTGLVNGVLGGLSGGAVQPNWLRDQGFALFAIMLVGIWQSAGFQMVIFLAGLQEIPAELYEAASIDGAGKWRQFRYITLPGLRNTLIFVVTVTTIFAFRLFDTVYIMTKGGPLGSTSTMLLQMFTSGFSQLQIGRGSAVAVIFFLFVLVVNLIQRFWLRQEGERS
jgi:multiple sugar transport system permease protein